MIGSGPAAAHARQLKEARRMGMQRKGEWTRRSVGVIYRSGQDHAEMVLR